MSITVDVIEYVLNLWKKTDEYAKYCMLNIENYKKSFNNINFNGLYDNCVSKIIIEFVQNEVYKVDIYADSMYLIYIDSEDDIISKYYSPVFDYKIHIISNSGEYALDFPLPLCRYDVRIDLSGVNKSVHIKINSLSELKQIGKKNYGFENIDLSMFISSGKDMYKILDTLLYLRYMKPNIIESHEAIFNFSCYNCEKEFKLFINHIERLINKYSQQSFHDRVLSKRDIKYICRTFSWYLDSSWFSSSANLSLSNINIISLNSNIMELLGIIKDKYGRIAICQESDNF